MYVLLTGAIVMRTWLIISAESERPFCGFKIKRLFRDAQNISETSRCGDLKRIKSFIKMFETSVKFTADERITDCTSPITSEDSANGQTSASNNTITKDIIVECTAPYTDGCLSLFLNLREVQLSSFDSTTFLDILSPYILNASSADVARCAANRTEQLSVSSERFLRKEKSDSKSRYIEEYLHSGRSVISLKIHQKRIYAHSYNASSRTLVRKLVILDGNVSSLLHYDLLINLTELEIFEASYNDLYDIPEDLFLFNGQLETCDLSHNALVEIPEYLFKNTARLETLTLNHNNLETLPPGLFLNNRRIQFVYLGHNRLNILPGALFKNNPEMLQLALNNNLLTELPWDLFPRNASLIDLDLSHNRLKSINLELLKDPTEKTVAELAKPGFMRTEIFLQTENGAEGVGIQGNTLVKTNKLVALKLTYNRLTNFPNDIFHRSQVLRWFDASHNPGISRFANSHFLYSLELITLTDSGVEYLEGILDNSVSSHMFLIKWLELSRNKIKHIDGTAFTKCYILEKITLKDNLITSLEPGLFTDLQNLYFLDLSGNMLSVLPFELLSVESLLHLNVSGNRVATFGDLPLVPLLNYIRSPLQELDLSHNCLTSSKLSSLNLTSNTLLSLIYANFEYNALVRIPVIPTGQRGFIFLFGRNNIRTVQLNSILDPPSKGMSYLTSKEHLMKLPEKAQVALCPNPIRKICVTSEKSCQEVTEETLHHLLKNFPYVNAKECQDSRELRNKNTSALLKMIKFQCPFEPSCPKDYYEAFLCDEDTECDLRLPLVCPITKQCPPPCECHKRGYEQISVVNCSHRNLLELPSFVPPNTKVLHFENNKLSNLSQFSEDIWKGLREVYLDYNEISYADLSHFPSSVSKISMRHNLLSTLSTEPLGNFTDTQIWLEGNPWLCDCSTLPFKTLANTSGIIADGNSIICANYNRSVVDISEEEMCIKKLMTVTNTSLSLLTGILIPTFVAIILVSYYRNKRTITAYIFAHHPRLFACFFGSEELEDKKFDAFISYSGTDTPIVKQFIEQLEEKEPYLRLCIHERDWLPGEEIVMNIENSVSLSRKTVLILSKEFLKSMWFSIELRSVYYQSVEDKVNRLIIVLKDGVPSLDTLDEDLQILLKTKTYLEWGERWFWEKLRYALSREIV